MLLNTPCKHKTPNVPNAAEITTACNHDGLFLARLFILGVDGLPGRTPFTCGVGAPDPSSSTFTPDGRLRLFDAGDVLALGPLELVPCWLCCICMAGACICPGAGLPPMCGEPGRFMWAAAGLAPIWNWLKLGVLCCC